jgi:hypothetical protein
LIIVTPPCQLTVTCVAPDLFALTEATSNVAGACALACASINSASTSVPATEGFASECTLNYMYCGQGPKQ